MSPGPSRVHIDADLTDPYFGHAWRDADGDVFATARLGGAYLVFTSAADARAAAAACMEAADAHDKLTADSNPATT